MIAVTILLNMGLFWGQNIIFLWHGQFVACARGVVFPSACFATDIAVRDLAVYIYLNRLSGGRPSGEICTETKFRLNMPFPRFFVDFGRPYLSIRANRFIVVFGHSVRFLLWKISRGKYSFPICGAVDAVSLGIRTLPGRAAESPITASCRL